jgi:hypothetical protein
MNKQSHAIILSAALVFGLSSLAHADSAKHRNHVAKPAPTTEALLRKLTDQNVYGMAITKPQSGCDDIRCPGFTLVGIGF